MPHRAADLQMLTRGHLIGGSKVAWGDRIRGKRQAADNERREKLRNGIDAADPPQTTKTGKEHGRSHSDSAMVILEVRITVYVCFRVGSTHLSIDVYRTMSYGTRVALSAQVKETRSTLRARQTSP